MQQTHNNLTFHPWFLVLYWSLKGKIASFSVFKFIRVAKTCLWTRSIRCVRYTPGGRFSKVPKTFRARKAIRKTPTCLSCNAGIFICCKGNKNKSNCEVSCLETPSFWRYKENYVTRNGPEKFRDFRETGPRPLTLNATRCKHCDCYIVKTG